jgi:hypothetical protein
VTYSKDLSLKAGAQREKTARFLELSDAEDGNMFGTLYSCMSRLNRIFWRLAGDSICLAYRFALSRTLPARVQLAQVFRVGARRSIILGVVNLSDCIGPEFSRDHLFADALEDLSDVDA